MRAAVAVLLLSSVAAADPPARPYRAAAIASAALAVGGVVSGAVLLALDGSEHRRAADAGGHLVVDRWSTAPAGWPCLALGAGFGAAAGALAWRDQQLQLTTLAFRF